MNNPNDDPFNPSLREMIQSEKWREENGKGKASTENFMEEVIACEKNPMMREIYKQMLEEARQK